MGSYQLKNMAIFIESYQENIYPGNEPIDTKYDQGLKALESLLKWLNRRSPALTPKFSSHRDPWCAGVYDTLNDAVHEVKREIAKVHAGYYLDKETKDDKQPES